MCFAATDTDVSLSCRRDLKPENAMGGASSGYVKIVDFGTAKYFEQVAAGGNQELKTCQDTDHQGLMLTVGYSSLETLAARKNRSVPFNPFGNDVHCLGAMLYVMLSGTNFPDNPTHEATQAALDAVSHLSASSDGSCRTLVEMMCAKESERITINDVLEHPWIKNTQETASLPEGVLAGLIKLTRGKMIDGNPGDYLVQEVGTTAYHIVERDRMAAIYDLSSAIQIDSLTAEQKTIMRKWEPAQKRGMQLYHATQVSTTPHIFFFSHYLFFSFVLCSLFFHRLLFYARRSGGCQERDLGIQRA